MIDRYIGKIIWADCLDVMKRLPDNCVDLVVTDPPYGMEYVTNHRKYTNTIAVPITGDDSYNEEFNNGVAKELHRIMALNSHAYIFCNDISWGNFRNTYSKHFNIKRGLVWEKDNWSAGDLYSDYGHKTEFILYATKGNKKLNGKRNHNVLRYDRVNNLLHSCQKPVGLISFLIIKSSKPTDLILDPFSGSGTTAVACHELNRRCISIEKELKYVGISRRRLQAVTAQGRLFETT